MFRFFTESIHGRFALLLIASLLFCNLAAAFLLAREGTAFDAAIRMQRDMGRLVALVESIEESDRETGAAILSRSTTGYTRFSIDAGPVGSDGAPQINEVAHEIMQALPGHDIRVIPGNPLAAVHERGPTLMIISVRIGEGVRKGEWLNSLVYPLAPSTVWGQKWAFFVPLFASLATALLVGLRILQQMTKPLKRLAIASLAAGRGDHSVRLIETGPQEIREAAVAFNTMQRQISEFESDRRRLLASIGHDLRTPITCLRIRAEVMEDETQREPMIETLEEMSVMVEDILNFSRDTANAEARRVTDLMQMAGQICAERALDFAAGAPILLEVQPVSLRRAFSNLVDNALRYAGNAEVSLTRQGDCVTFTVRDAGPGIAEDRLDTVMEAFVRGEESRCRETGGLGLGLTIARDIVVNHGGRLSLRNRPEGGLSAEVSLPGTVLPAAGAAMSG
ncbi:ATP-binding protein [Pseudogemmobacter humi]|uniref:histidine kinase n=1 Tax=Pseudogemmobacter humi TaxID=2483812 RepID=A0A3P5XWD5_9RHOB|nr:ATP-binding protein [Pseudogemmobacter humi]VDC33435.1 Osmolarity sensor protein EnvZ [Pseudogemmobacter humi]